MRRFKTEAMMLGSDQAAEQARRVAAKLAADADAGEWWLDAGGRARKGGLTPRPARTYRAARRNAARGRS